jgi:hypothetical protein
LSRGFGTYLLCFFLITFIQMQKEKKVTEEPVRINIKESWELEWWPWRLGVSKTELIRAVKSVGPALHKVKHFLMRRRGNRP